MDSSLITFHTSCCIHVLLYFTVSRNHPIMKNSYPSVIELFFVFIFFYKCVFVGYVWRLMFCVKFVDNRIL